MSDLYKKLIKNLSIAVLYDRHRTSFCWKYFGHLVVLNEANKKKTVDTDQVYCLACLKAVKEESEDVTFGSIKIKQYNKTVSTGNLARHLRDEHNIEDDAPKKSDKANNEQNESMTSKPGVRRSSKRKYNKEQLARDLALFCCKSLLPFDFVSGEGSVDFFKKYNIIPSRDDLPSRTDVSGAALDELCDSILNRLQDDINLNIITHVAMTFELWTDQRRQLNYITSTLHYLTPDFELKHFTLNTQLVERKANGEQIGGIIRDIKQNFGLLEMKIYAVTDGRDNINQAVSLANMDHHVCLSHSFHNLVTVDGIRKVPELYLLVEKCKKLIMTVNYNLSELEVDAKKKQKDLLCSLDSVVCTLEGDESDPIPETNCIEHEEVEESNLTKSEHVADSTAIPTRWHSILEMLDCLTRFCNRDPINKMLRRIGKGELQITQTEWNILEELVTFLKSFQEAVEVMSSQETCTLNVALLFRAEIIDVLNRTSDKESEIISRLKLNMTANINNRFPVTKATVAAALLDNRFINILEVDRYLSSNSMTRTSFLASYTKEIVTDRNAPIQVKSEYEDRLASTSSNDGSLLHKLSLKHRVSSCQGSVQSDPIDQECWRYVATADPSEPKDGDLLSYWNRNASVFPWLSSLARAILCIPATCVPNRRAFTANGLAFSTQRSRLTPMKINKVLFVHDNYKK